MKTLANIPHKRYVLGGTAVVTALLFALNFNSVLAAFASWGDTSLVHACVASNGTVKIVGSGSSCGPNETQTTWLKDIDAGSGLSISRSSSGATLSLDETRFKAFQVNPTDSQISTSTTYEDMASGTQQITLSQRSIVQVNAHANTYVSDLPTSFEDFTSNDNDLTNNNGVSEYATTLPFQDSSSAADFESSSSQYLSITDAAQTALDLTNDLTFEAWIRIESDLSSGTQRAIVSKYLDTNNNRSYFFDIRNDSGTRRLDFRYSTDGTFQSANIAQVDWDFSSSVGQWVHVAVTFDASVSTTKFYVNGAQQGSPQVTTGTSIYNGSGKFYLGALEYSAGNTLFFDGVMDEVRVWNVVRTETEINNNKSLELTGSESNLVAYYPFEFIGSSLGYVRTTYDSGGADTEIGKEGYTNVITDGQSVSAGGVVVLDSGTYTIAMQKKVNASGATATYNNSSMSIVLIPTE
jgi:hypothetical protein